MYGIFGKILEVNLTDKSYSSKNLPENIYRDYLGGYGLAAWYIYNNLSPGTDPLSSDNILALTPGLFSGTNIPMSGRFMVSAKSPLTSTWGDSNVGGFFGPNLKKSGFDAVFIKGVSDSPLYLFIENEKVEFYSASDLWGKVTTDTEKILREKHLGSQVLSIGPAGENLSLISCIITDYGRAAGRSGLGAVMGSKKLKAIVVHGTVEVPIFDKEELRVQNRNLLNILNPAKNKSVGYWHKYGTTGGTESSHLSGDAPIKNWKGVGIIDFGKDKAKAISGEEIYKDKVRPYACANCSVACGGWIRRETKYGLVEGHRLEYEATAQLGGLVLNGDLDTLTYAFELSNRLGYDVISLGGVIAFAMECYENGIITDRDLGFALNWGNSDSMIKLIELMGKNEGIGKILNEGVYNAGKKFNAEQFAVHVHGQELPAHDPKYLPSLGTTYVTDPTPGRHTAGGLGFSEGSVPRPAFPINETYLKLEKYRYAGKGKAHAVLSNASQVLNCLGFCMFSDIFSQFPYPELIRAVTGWNVNSDELLKTGERIQALRQAFNIREGLNPRYFKISGRAIGNPSQINGPLKDVTLDLESMVREYYEAMHWNVENGKPDKERLNYLGLKFVKI